MMRENIGGTLGASAIGYTFKSNAENDICRVRMEGIITRTEQEAKGIGFGPAIELLDFRHMGERWSTSPSSIRALKTAG